MKKVIILNQDINQLFDTQNVYILEDRGILYINGLDTKEFLQNLMWKKFIRLMKVIVVLLHY